MPQLPPRLFKALTTEDIAISDSEANDLAERLDVSFGDAEYTLITVGAAMLQLAEVVGNARARMAQRVLAEAGAEYLAFLG